MNPPRPKILLNLCLALFSVVLMLLVLEGILRLVLLWGSPAFAGTVSAHQQALQRALVNDPQFIPHPYLSYAPADVRLATDGCSIGKNRFSFDKPPFTLRIACLGGSTTKNSYPKPLKEALSPCFPNLNIEVMDWGCPGWTMVETELDYVLRVRAFHPDVLILHHGINDVAPRLRRTYRYDYSHYRLSYEFPGISWFDRLAGHSVLAAWTELRLGRHLVDLDVWTVQQPKSGEWLDLDKLPGKESLRAYEMGLETIHRLGRADGATLIVAGMVYNVTGLLTPRLAKVVDEFNDISREFCRNNELLYVDTQAVFRHDPAYFMDQCHMIGFADEAKALLLANAIARALKGAPRLRVTDTLEEAEDLSQGFDNDPPDHRELAVRWNFPQTDIRDVHVWMQIDGGKRTYLGKSIDPQKKALVWKAGELNIDPPFREGPGFGHSYWFSAWAIGEATKVYPPIFALGPVEYKSGS